MHAKKRTRIVSHHEWTLPSPAHFTDIEKAVAVAQNHAALIVGHPVDIWISCNDDEVVIGYSRDEPQHGVTLPEQRDGDGGDQ